MTFRFVVPLAWIGRFFLNSTPFRLFYDFCRSTGELFFLFITLIRCFSKIFLNFGFTIHQMYSIGVTSMGLVFVTAIFTGGIAAWQAAYQFSNLVPLTYLGMAVCKAVTIELGPVLTALVLAGRIGSGIGAEIGTM